MTHADLYPCDNCGRESLYPVCEDCGRDIPPPKTLAELPLRRAAILLGYQVGERTGQIGKRLITRPDGSQGILGPWELTCELLAQHGAAMASPPAGEAR